ncbi:MAG: DUF2238 domain-containing protein [Candidatus Pacearchaeota archaeon]|jgi:putative membrane protein
MKIKKSDLVLLIINIVYLIIFAFLFLGKKNYEFLLYIGVVIFFLILISLLHLKVKFSYDILIGLTAWGLLHMLGGAVIVNNEVLYAYWIFPFLRYDMFVHFFGFGVTTLLAYHLLKPYLRLTSRSFLIGFFLVLIAMGFGALNEIIEFIAVILVPETGVGGYNNTMWDIIFNTFGGIAGVIYLRLRKR